MEEFESYLEARNFRFSSWTEFLENENIDIWNNKGCENTEQGVQLLPRQDVALYGIIPKLEKRSFSSCKNCEHVFNPKDILLHKNCSFKVKSPHVSSHFKKKVKSKKKPPPGEPLYQTGLKAAPPVEELSTIEIRPNSILIVNANKLPTVETNAKVAIPEPPQLVEEVAKIPLPTGRSLPVLTDSPPPPEPAIVKSVEKAPKVSSHTNSHSHSSSRSKKKKHTKSHREPETNKQSGLVQDLKGPSTRSIKYSNHNSGNEHRNKKRREERSLGNDYFHQNNTQEIPISVPIVYMPMSPVSPVTSLQLIQDGNIVCLDNTGQVLPPTTECPRQVYLSIPEHLNVVYKARPKPCSLPIYGAQKMGGAIVISKRKLNIQRKDILAAINSKHKTNDILSSYKTSSLNNSHRQNILKNKNNKSNSKKSTTDRNVNNDIKHIHLTPDINGFLIHGDVSKSNEDQQNYIHDSKISSMNIK